MVSNDTKMIDKWKKVLYNMNEGSEMKKRIITKEEIEEILEKYQIGKKPLSLVLGWGENTIIRYLDGQIPDSFHSDILLKIKEDYHEFLRYLEKNKELITPLAYKKAISKITELKLEENQSTVYLVAKYVIVKTEDITPLALQKILYYIEGFSLALLHRKIFYTECEAWAHGPVYPEIYACFSPYRYHPIEKENFIGEVSLDLLSKEEVQLIDQVIKCFGCYSGKILEAMTHQTDPWLMARGKIEEAEISNHKISTSNMQDFFSKVCYEYQITSLKDIFKYSKKMFQRIVK